MNTSVTAFTKIQSAVGGDTSAITSDDFADILHLQGFVNANEAAYLAAIGTATSLIDLSALNALLNNTNNEQTLLASVNAIDTLNPLDVTDWQADSILSDIATDTAFVDAYNAEVMERQPLADIAAVQSLVVEVNASVTALTKIQSAAGGDTTGIVTADFSAILHLNHFDANNEAAYLAAIGSASSVADVEGLSALLLTTNQEQTLLVAVNGITEVAPLDITDWQADAVLTDLQNAADFVDTYNSEAIERQPFADIATIQLMIGEVNASVNALAKINAAAGGNTSAISLADFAAILHLENYEAANFANYLVAVGAAGSVVDLTALNALVLVTNQEQTLLAAVNAITQGAGLDQIQWQADSLLTNVLADPNLTQYNSEAIERQPFSDMAALQTLVDEVNTSVTAFTKIQSAVGGDTSAITSDDFADILHLQGFVNANE
ncbi:MAG: hypothetical protein GY880_05430, partial [Planctomycetaceae bacterium]|nr:hypothetical protein [Planctomycetaceae bacterium]